MVTVANVLGVLFLLVALLTIAPFAWIFLSLVWRAIQGEPWPFG